MFEWFIATQVARAFVPGVPTVVDLLAPPEKGGSKYNDGLVHGHCRWGECSCIFVGEWIDRHSKREECPAAPWEICPCCGGAAIHMNKTGQQAPCTACRGGGIPGPHWPWRFDMPPPLPPAACAGPPPDKKEEKEEKEDGRPDAEE